MEPGDRPRLTRPPSDRFVAPERRDEPRGPRTVRALAFGGIGAAVLALLWLLVAGLFGVDYGVVVLAAIGGWAVGSAVAYGAWGERAHDRVPVLGAAAVGCALAGWLGGNVLDWIWSQAALPGSELPLGERLAQTPFGAWFGGQVSILTALEVALLAAVSWRSSR